MLSSKNIHLAFWCLFERYQSSVPIESNITKSSLTPENRFSVLEDDPRHKVARNIL